MSDLFLDDEILDDADVKAAVTGFPRVKEVSEPLAVVSLNFEIKGYSGMFVLKDIDELSLAKRLENLLITFEAREDIKPQQRWSRGSGSTEAAAAQGESVTFECVQFVLQKRTDGKMEIQFFPLLGDGNVGQYSECTFVGTKEALWEKAGEVLRPFAIKAEDLPVKRECKWSVTYTLGRPTGKTDKQGKPTHYRDLQSVSQAG